MLGCLNHVSISQYLNISIMKFNWGTGIFIFYSVFAASLFYQVFASTKYDNDLVEENYYEKDLAYQSRYERIENSLKLENKLMIKYDSELNQVVLNFPESEKSPTGKIRLYRADDEKKDLRMPVLLMDGNEMRINAEELTEGVWKIEVEWELGELPCFDSKSIYIKK